MGEHTTVLDENGEQCPVGVTGKLASTGHIPLGCFKDPDKTAATFPIYPEEVEAALKKNPAIFDAVVVGTPSERWGEQVTAIVQARPGHDIAQAGVRAHCRTVLSDFKTPRTVLFVDTVQRTPSGKADYKWAKETALSLLAAG